MKYNYQIIKQEVETYLLTHPDEYFYTTDIAKALGYTNYVINNVLKIISTDKIMTYTSEKLVYVTKNNQEKQIPESYIDKFLNNGWIFGRCELSKRSICIAEGGDPDKIKTCWVHNSNEELEIPITAKSKYLDIGYESGKRRVSGTKGKIAVHRDNIDKYIIPEELDTYIADGWLPGGKEKRELRDYSNVWNKGQTKHTDPRLQLLANNVRESNLNMSQETKDKISISVKKLWENDEYRNNHHIKAMGHVPWNKGLRGVVKWTEERRIKHNETKRQNNSFNKSKAEEDFYESLLLQYDKDDIVRQYYDKERYPFHCDFYIRSEDLFIECNFHWTHNIKPFDQNCEEDIKEAQLLLDLSEKSEFYKVAHYVWTELDVRKYQYAKQNNLNYRRYYKNGICY